MDLLYQCDIVRERGANPNLNLSTVLRPDSWTKVFQPTVAGMAKTALTVEKHLYHDMSGFLSMRILAVGDSITRGSGLPLDQNGYRGFLNTLLTSQIYPVRWIGRQRGSSTSRLWHEGYSGATVAEIIGRLEPAGSPLDQRPNVVLLMIGTNNIDRNAAIDGSIAQLEELLNLIRNRAGRDTLILISSIIPQGPSKCYLGILILG